MPKSNYPGKIDTSVELRPVRDNITEIGSDVINSLRSAIFQIEKTLGVNPHGASGNTVASRIDSVIDESGGIKKEAFDSANLLSGPILNNDVAKTAAIEESKLKLNFPTNLLQDEISIISGKLGDFTSLLEELAAKLSAHIHPDALNRHFGKSIDLIAANVQQKTSAAMKLERGTVQQAFEDIYNAHINFSPELMSAENNSHFASQIYYDNSNTIDFIDANSAQGAIDEMVALEGKALQRSMLNLHSNGLIRTGALIDAYEGLDKGRMILDESEINYSGPSSDHFETIIFTNPKSPKEKILQFDVLTISGLINDEDNKEYLISSVDLDADGKVASIDIYGGPKTEVSSGASAKVTKSIYSVCNENALNCSVRPRFNKSNTPDVHFAHPDSATIISFGVNVDKVDEENRKIAIEIDGAEKVEIDVFNESFGEGGQTLESVVYAINEYSVDNKLNIMAYKLRRATCYEIAISHIVPNMEGDFQNRTLKIVEPSANSALDALGFSGHVDVEVEGAVGSLCLINGKLVDKFGKIRKYLGSEISLKSGTNQIFSRDRDVNFLDDGIKEGDLILISGSSIQSDNIIHRINDVYSDHISVDFSGDFFSGLMDFDATAIVMKSSANIGKLEFDLEGTSGGILFDVFATSEGDVYFNKRMTVGEMPREDSFHSAISGVSRDFLVNGEVGEVVFRPAEMVIPANIQAQIDPLEERVRVLEDEVRKLILELTLNREEAVPSIKSFLELDDVDHPTLKFAPEEIFETFRFELDVLSESITSDRETWNRAKQELQDAVQTMTELRDATDPADAAASPSWVTLGFAVDELKDLEVKFSLEVSSREFIINFATSQIGENQDKISSINLEIEELKEGAVPGPGVLVSLVDAAGREGSPIKILETGSYKILSADKFSFVNIDFKVFNNLKLSNLITKISLLGHSEVPRSGYLMARGLYSTNMGLVLGMLPSAGARGGIPVLRDMRRTGTTDKTIISENFIEKYIQGPRNELRGSGIIRGFEIKSIDISKLPRVSMEITSGVAVVNGIRYEYKGDDNFVTYKDINFFLAIDSMGCIVAEEAWGKVSPFADKNFAHIAYIDVTNKVSKDLRLFVDHLDFKVIADITVANDHRFGHFTDIKKAVDYARMFTLMFPEMGRPSITIKEGEHIVEETIIIDFDVMIRGAGPQTIIKRGESLARLHEDEDNLLFTESSIRNGIFCVGSQDLGSSDDIIYGVTFSDFTLKTSEFLSSGNFQEPIVTNSMIFITQSLNDSPDAFFRFINLNFIGPENIDREFLHEFAIIMTRPHDKENRTALKFGNLVVSNCHMVSTGNEAASIGSAYANNPTNYTENVIISSNVFSRVSPGEGSAGAGNYGVFGISNGEDDSMLGIFGPEMFAGNARNVVITEGNVATDGGEEME